MAVTEITSSTRIRSRSELKDLYQRTFPAVASYVAKHGGSYDEARDIFHDATVIYLEGTTEINSSAEAYIYGVARHLWLKKFRDEKIFVHGENHNFTGIDDSDSSVNTSRLLQVLKVTGRKCLDLLQAFYFEKENLAALAGKLGFSNVHSASVQKYKCLEKVRDQIKSNNLSYEDFLE